MKSLDTSGKLKKDGWILIKKNKNSKVYASGYARALVRKGKVIKDYVSMNHFINPIKTDYDYLDNF